MRKDFLDGNYAEKEVTLTIRVPADFDREDERMLDDAISYLLQKNGYDLVESKEYRDVPPAQENIVSATFVSVWDGGYHVETPCKVNMETGYVFDIEVSEGTADFVDVLDEEFIRLPDGTEHSVRNPDRDDEGFFWYGSEKEYVLEPLEFVFDEEITVSEDRTELEGYVWAMDSLVARLQAQVPPLGEDEFMENINFYPIYNVANHTVKMEGHYYLEDGHYARGRAFVLPLSETEAKDLITAFEAYCVKREGQSCAEFLESVLSSEPSMKAVDIQWDVDDPADLDQLPTEMEIPARLLKSTDEEAISDYLSSETGFCHAGFRLVDIKAADKVSLSDQIQSASSRADVSKSFSEAPTKDLNPEK